ncbi:hypothetical protein FRB94_013388 [Tulasnella sp. JGI-2019a]|nr:hypothetical protein FRB93_002499 [Tulasnella sp. JGI-2019a]KAG9008342.1 hypothetical protein FRB94_013388 [Tulasnella sp. JGI-2019a]
MASILQSVRSAVAGPSRNYNWLPQSPARPSLSSSQGHWPSDEYDLEASSSLSTRSSEPLEEESGGFLGTRPVLRALLKLAALFIVGSILMGGTLYLALPPLDETDRPNAKIPTNFEELKALNALMKKLKTVYPMRTVLCFIVSFLYVQAFSLPGSMYLAILGGAVWGVPVALPLASFCTATGASLCYLISACFGPALFALPRLRVQIESVADKVGEPHHRDNMIPYLMILRMVPVPPNWTVNLACPHLGVDIVTFWIAAFLGILGLSAIHATIGSGLDQMTSSDDFHLLSWQNAFAFATVLFGAILPIILKRRWREELNEIEGVLSSQEHEMSESTPQTQELSTLSTVIFEATDFDAIPPDTPIGSLGLMNVGRTPATAEFWPDRRISLLLQPVDRGHDRRWASFDHMNMASAESFRR